MLYVICMLLVYFLQAQNLPQFKYLQLRISFSKITNI